MNSRSGWCNGVLVDDPQMLEFIDRKRVPKRSFLRSGDGVVAADIQRRVVHRRGGRDKKREHGNRC